MRRSCQYINFDGIMKGETANYVVLNVSEILQQLLVFNPLEISAYGYWGTPSETAVCPYDKICFSAFSIIKREPTDNNPVNYN